MFVVGIRWVIRRLVWVRRCWGGVTDVGPPPCIERVPPIFTPGTT